MITRSRSEPSFSRNGALPQGTAANFIGLFTFPTDVPFNAADPTTYPYRFGISMGQFDFDGNRSPRERVRPGQVAVEQTGSR